MDSLKAMPTSEKHDMVIDDIAFIEQLTADFIREHLGDQASTDLRTAYQQGMAPIPEDAAAEERYETAYGNWIWMGKTAFGFIREHMGDEGIRQFMDVRVEALKRKNAGPSLRLLSFIRALAPKTAFKMTARKFAYRLQWFTPFTVEEIGPDKAVFDIPSCKILEHPETDDLCQVGCQRIYPRWVAEQLKVATELDPQGHRCRCTLTPLS